jgi:hypothetical protein
LTTNQVGMQIKCQHGDHPIQFTSFFFMWQTGFCSHKKCKYIVTGRLVIGIHAKRMVNIWRLRSCTYYKSPDNVGSESAVYFTFLCVGILCCSFHWDVVACWSWVLLLLHLVDKCCRITFPCFHATGKLILHLVRDTYEQLGLEGKPSAFSGRNPAKFGTDLFYSTLLVQI